MKLILGLGNPEPRYDHTRHNVGFLVCDAIVNQRGASFKHNEKFKADVAEYTVAGEKILIAKPTTYYNLAGESARAIADFYKIVPQDILLIHDELALPFGTLRTRAGGSDAGNNGIKSLNQHLGNSTQRLRIGTWNEHRDQIDDVAFVLSKFSQQEQQHLQNELMPIILEQVGAFTDGELQHHTLRVQM